MELHYLILLTKPCNIIPQSLGQSMCPIFPLTVYKTWLCHSYILVQFTTHESTARWYPAAEEKMIISSVAASSPVNVAKMVAFVPALGVSAVYTWIRNISAARHRGVGEWCGQYYSEIIHQTNIGEKQKMVIISQIGVANVWECQRKRCIGK